MKQLVLIIVTLSLLLLPIKAFSTVINFTQMGKASYYADKHHGKKTASGEKFNMYAMTAAHRRLPLGCMVRVTNNANGKSVIVKINDRGPYTGGRVLDLSYGAAKALGMIKSGVTSVTIERVE